MRFDEAMISSLKNKVSARISERRFRHTLGVERAASRIAAEILPESINEIRCAALLHDVTKELSVGEHIEIMNALSERPTDSDYMSQPLYHSITAPVVIRRDFPEYATQNILSAVRNHTSGAPDMSLFDEIIFLADFIEDNRTYEACKEIREEFFSSLDTLRDREEKIQMLHKTTVKVLDFTIVYIVNNTMYLNERTVETRNAFLGRFPVPLKKEY